MAVRVWRQLLVWLHVLSSVGWMSQAVTLAVLLGLSLTSTTTPSRTAYAQVAERLDSTVLILSANASALTGFLLAATTTWGYFRYWWVTAKFLITFTQLYLGIFVLSAAMPDVVAAAETGAHGPTGRVAVGAGLMAGALAFQAWLSVTKPWGRTPAGQRARVRPAGAPAWVLAAAVAAVVLDIPLGVAMIPLIDNPAPALALVALTMALVTRTRRHRREGRSRAAGSGATTGPSDVRRVLASVTRAQLITPEVMAVDLTPEPPAAPVAWAPGAHLDLCLPSGLVRQYSLYGDPDQEHYSVAVLLEPEGRGGSREIHALTAGQVISLQGPRNHFPLVPAEAYLFIAGGIGIVPLLPMIHQVNTGNRPWTLLYRGRTLAHMPFAADLVRRYGDRVRLRPADSTPRPDLADLLRTQSDKTAVYGCGPPGMTTALEQLMPTACPTGTLQLEKFTPTDRSELVNQPFTVELDHSGQSVPVPAETSTLDALRTALPDLPASCETGLCGSCELPVLAGRPDHRDDILHGQQRRRTDLFYPCVSRSFDPRLVIDA